MDPIERLARRIRGVERLAFKAATQPQLAHSSIEDGAIQSVVDGSLKAIIGQQFDGTQAVTLVNGPPPPTPSAPLVVAEALGAKITWDGLFANALVAPMDFARVEIHVSTDSGLTGDLAETLVGTYETPRGGEFFVRGASGTTYYARFVARSLSGARSAASAVTSFATSHLGAVDIPELADAVNSANQAIADAAAAQSTADQAVRDYVTEYAVNSSETVAPTAGWSAATPTRAAGEFIWFRVTVTHNDNSTSTTSPALLTGNAGATGAPGPQGSQGVPGPAGADGQQMYTWLKYADSPTTGMSDSPTGKTYMGLAYNKTTATESTTYTDYSWSLIKGADGATGAQGVQGPAGANGQPTYTWVKYGTSAAGAGLTDDPTGMTYIGLAYNKLTATESTTATDYTWSLIQGPQGAQGPQGSQGVQGPAGANGQPTYTWLKYADSPTTGMSDSPTGKTYMGLAYNKTTATESTTYTDYDWSLIKGADGATGAQGVQGPAGANGQPTYTWIKYGTSAAGAGLTDDPTGMTYIGLAYNKLTATESTTASDYTWSLIQGPQGPTGSTGSTGVSVTAVVPYFAQVTTGAAAPSKPTVTTPPAPWVASEPTYAANTELYRTEKVTFSDGSFAYTTVVKSSSYAAATSAASDIAKVHVVSPIPSLTAQSPATGSIAWPSFHVKYGNVDYTVAAGNTSLKWVTFLWNNGAPSISTSDTRPTLAPDDFILFANSGGVGMRIFSTTLVSGDLLVDGSVTSGALATKAVTTDKLDANAVSAEKLAANIVLGTTIATGVSGADRVVLDAAGIQVLKADNSQRAVLPTDPTQPVFIKGTAELDSAVINDKLTLRGTNNAISPGTTLQLQGAVQNPQSQVSVTTDWETVQTWADPTQYSYAVRGLDFDGGGYHYANLFFGTQIMAYNEAGQFSGNIGLPDLPAGVGSNYSGTYQAYGGIVKVAGYYYTLGTIHRISDNRNVWQVRKWTLDFINTAYTFVAYADIGLDTIDFNGSGTNPILGKGLTTGLSLAWWGGVTGGYQLVQREINTTTCALAGTTATNYGPVIASGNIGDLIYFEQGNFDFGAARSVFAHKQGGGQVVRSFNGTTQVVEDTFTLPAGTVGVCYNPTATNSFRSMQVSGTHVFNVKHSLINWITGGDSTTANWWSTFTYRNTSSGYETAQSLGKLFTMEKRKRLTITTPAIPPGGTANDPNAVRIWVGTGVAQPARTAMWTFATPAVGVLTATVNNQVFGSPNTNPPAANNFPASATSKLISSDGTRYLDSQGDALFRDISARAYTSPISDGSGPLFKLNADGSGRAGPVSWTATGANSNDTGWLTPTLSSGWTSVGGWMPPAYRKLNGVVHLRGTMISGTLGQAPFFLPSGMKPNNNLAFFGISSTYGRTQIRTDGALFIDWGGSNGHWSLDGINFLPDA